ncbi:MAG: hypothetical protein QXK21_01550 [Candidatus Micrarchaeia archaeon]
MDFISKYKNNPDLLIREKMKKLLYLESKMLPDMDKIKTPSQFFKEVKRFDQRRDDLGISIFRDIISLDFAKIITQNTNLELKDAFRMVKDCIDMPMARKLFDREAVKVKDAVLFQLNKETREEIADSFIKQIKSGKKKLKLPKRFYNE